MQNGVANERFALRRFPNVHGVTVMMPAAFLAPGEVAAFGDAAARHLRHRPLSAPAATPTTRALAAALEAANIAGLRQPTT